MDILVLGGTGAMGSYLVEILSKQGNKVFVTSRREHKNKSSIEYLCGDAHSDEFIVGVLKRRYDAIIDFMSYKTKEFKRRYEQYLKQTDQYIFLSSARVYADNKIPLKEDSPRLLDVCKDTNYLKTDEYALTKARQENILKDSGLMNWTIIRPYITYSDYRLQLGTLEKEYWLNRALKGHSIVFSKDILGKTTTLTYGFDVSNSIASLVGKNNALSRTFHITGDNSMTWENVLNIYLQALKRNGVMPNIHLTEKSLRLKFQETKWQVMYDRCFHRSFDNTVISEFVNISEFKPIAEGLTQCLESFLSHPKFLNSAYLEDALYDRITGERMKRCDYTSRNDYLKYLFFRYVYGSEYLIILKQKIKFMLA